MLRHARRRLLASLLMLVSCAAMGQAGKNLSNNWGTSSFPQIAVDPAGTVVNVVWLDNSSGAAQILFSRSVDGGQTFSAPTNISGAVADLLWSQPLLSVDAGGNINVAWEVGATSPHAVYFTRSSDGGATFSAPMNLSGEGGYGPHLAFDSLARIFIIWSRPKGLTGSELVLVRSSDGGKTFSAPVTLSTTGYAGEGQVLVDKQDNINLTWIGGDGGIQHVYFARSTDGGTTFLTSAQPLGWDAWEPQLAVDSQGNILLAWMDDAVWYDVMASYSDDGGTTFSTPTAMSNGTAYSPRVTIDSNDHVYLAWYNDDDGDLWMTGSAKCSPLSVSMAPVTPYSTAPLAPAQPAVDSSGHVNVLWSDQNLDEILLSRGTAALDDFTPPENLSNSAGRASYSSSALDTKGNIFVVWAQAEASSLTDIYFARRDAATITHVLSVSTTGSGAVSSAPALINCRWACSGSFAQGTTVVLTATPSLYGKFTGWSGDCSGAATECTVTIDAAKSVTATFTDLVADLGVTLTGSPDPVGLGSDVTFTAQIANAGPDPATNVQIAFTSSDSDINWGYSGVCWPGAPSCPLTIAPGETVTAKAVGATTALGPLTMSVNVRYNASSNNTAGAQVTVEPARADLTLVSFTGYPQSVNVGESITYSIVIRNNGRDMAWNVVLSDPLPAALSFVSASGSGPNQSCSAANGLVTCRQWWLGPGATTSFALLMKATAAGTLTHIANVSSDATDPFNADNALPVTTTVIAAADTTSPVVSVTSPQSGASVFGPAVSVAANATDNVGVVGVSFAVDGVSLGAEDTAAPFSIVWNSTEVSNGVHSLSATARDAAGNQSTATITVTVNNPDTVLPTVSITAPAGGALAGGNNVVVSAAASDNVGVVGVSFAVDGVSLGAEDTAAPFSIVWNTTEVSNGAHSLSATARDAAGNQSTATITVRVNNPDTVLPTVSITAPAGGAFTGGNNVVVSAAASDNVGVVGVVFKLDNAVLGVEDTEAPYAITWNTTLISNGAHTLMAVARDAAGNIGYASSVVVTVNNNTEFVLAPPAGSSTSVTANAGTPAVFNLTLAPTYGFTGPVTFTCANLPPAAACAVNPNPANVSGTAATPLTITLTTTAHSAVNAVNVAANRGSPLIRGLAAWSWSLWLAGMFISGRRSVSKRARIATLLTVCLLIAMAISCGGGGSNLRINPPPVTTPSQPSGTPSGTYTVTVTGSAAGVTHDILLTLKVN